jgi:hypothetical protein
MLHPDFEYFRVQLVADPGVDMSGGVETVHSGRPAPAWR